MTLSDQTYARMLLRLRNDGSGWKTYVRANAGHYARVAGFLAVMLIAAATNERWRAFAFVLGILAGAVVRELALLRTLHRQRVQRMRMIDWEIVQKLADGEPVPY